MLVSNRSAILDLGEDPLPLARRGFLPAQGSYKGAPIQLHPGRKSRPGEVGEGRKHIGKIDEIIADRPTLAEHRRSHQEGHMNTPVIGSAFALGVGLAIERSGCR